MAEFSNELSKELLDELGSKRKGHITRFIEKNFRKDVDYIVTKSSHPKIGRGGRNEIVYMLTDETMELVRSTYNMKNKYVRKVKDTAVKCIVMSVENSTIGFICNALKPLFNDMIRQFKVGTYRVDLYIPNIKLCIECDEGGHQDYDASMEAERQAYIEAKLSCTFIRFNPNADGFDVSNVISDILRKFVALQHSSVQK